MFLHLPDDTHSTISCWGSYPKSTLLSELVFTYKHSLQRIAVLIAAALSPYTMGKLTGREGRCRDTGYDKSRRDHNDADQLTHVSCLHKGCEVALSVLPCKRGIAPSIAVAEHCLLSNARAMPTCAW